MKAGVASIAFGVLEKYDLNVPIIPVGLNYLYYENRGHRFRGRVVIEFGPPIHIDKALSQKYKKSKRDATNELLHLIEDGMRSVIVPANNYQILRLIHVTRRLYQRATSGITTTQKQDLARRFAFAYFAFEKKYGKFEDGKWPEDIVQLRNKIEAYDKTLSLWGLKDYQVCNLHVPYSKVLYKFIHGFITMSLASIPSLLLNAPVGLIASFLAIVESKKDKEKSSVKVKGLDVILSKKITYTLIGVPILWIMYAVMLWTCTTLSKRTVILLFLSCPVFSYFGVMAVEAGMVDIKDMKPWLYQILPFSGFQNVKNELPETRQHLVTEVRKLVKKYGPELGSLYTAKVYRFVPEGVTDGTGDDASQGGKKSD